MTSTVRPSPSRSIASADAPALSGSRLAVGSSRTTSGASRRNALARAMRCRSPAESGRPAVADDRVVPVRQRADEGVRAGEPRRGDHARVVRRRVAQPDVVGDRSAEERRALRHPGEHRRQPPGRRRRGRRRRRSRARRSALRARAAVRRPCSCRAARPDERDRLPGTELEVDVVENGGARAPGTRTRRARGERRRAGLGGSAAADRPRSRPRSVQVEHASATARPSALAWYCAPRLRSGRYSSGASIRIGQCSLQPDTPAASRTPTVTATRRRRASLPAPARRPRGTRLAASSWSPAGSARWHPRSRPPARGRG